MRSWHKKSSSLAEPLSQEQLKSLLEYHPDHGYFVWTRNAGPRRHKRVAGIVVATGYRRISIYGRGYAAHRLAWLYVYGIMPERIDHINGDGDDNRIANLRLATASQNRANSRLPSSNSSGAKGVHIADGKFVASVTCGGKRKHLGAFDTLDEAAKAYMQGAKDEFGEFASAGTEQEPVIRRKGSRRSRMVLKRGQKYLTPKWEKDFLNKKP